MSNFVGRPPFSNSLWVAIETMQFHIAQTKIFLRTPSFPIQGVPMNNLAPMKNCPGGVQGNLNWMPGYNTYGHFSSKFSQKLLDLGSGFYRTQYPASYTHKSLGRTPQFSLPMSTGTQTCLLCLSLKSQIPKLFRNDSVFPIFTAYL